MKKMKEDEIKSRDAVESHLRLLIIELEDEVKRMKSSPWAWWSPIFICASPSSRTM